MSDCTHELLYVKRYASGFHWYTYDMNNLSDPWEFADDKGELSIPTFGECTDCGKRIRIPKED